VGSWGKLKVSEGGFGLEKKIYYVTVDVGPRTGQIREQIELNDANYDFEIFATAEEVAKLQQLLTELQETDFQTFALAHIPFLDNDQAEDRTEDRQIEQVYRMIYQLGTEQTKEQIRRAGII
jgi:hypothetical protein